MPLALPSLFPNRSDSGRQPAVQSLGGQMCHDQVKLAQKAPVFLGLAGRRLSVGRLRSPLVLRLQEPAVDVVTGVRSGESGDRSVDVDVLLRGEDAYPIWS